MPKISLDRLDPTAKLIRGNNAIYASIHVHTDLRLKIDKIEVNLFFNAD